MCSARSKDLLLVITSGVGGGGVTGPFLGLARAFSSLGIKVIMFASNGEQHEGMLHELVQAGVIIHQHRCFVMDSSVARSQSTRKIVNIIEAGAFPQHNIVLLGFSLREAIVFYHARSILRRTRRVISCIQPFSLRHQSRIWPFYYFLGSQFYRVTVDHLFAACHTEQSKMLAFGFPKRRCSVAHLPISSLLCVKSSGLEQHPSTELTKMLNQLAGAEYLCFLGDFSRTKGQRVLVRMMPYLLHEYPNLHLVLAGTGPQLAQCKKEANMLGLKNAVLFPGRLPQTDMPLLLGACRMAVVGSYSETFGYCIAEPLLLHVPVVSTNVGVASELNLLGAIRTFRKGDARGAALQVAETLRNVEDASIRTELGYKYVTATCLPDAIAATMLKVWGMLL
jgi:glycosyltransferase involved in cell wall biosynthesis